MVDTTPGIRTPYVGTGVDGALRSAEIDRAEADTHPTGSPRWRLCMRSAERWVAQAETQWRELAGADAQQDPLYRLIDDAGRRRPASFGPEFHFGTYETLADGTVVHYVVVRHHAAVPDAGDDGEELQELPEPMSRRVGVVWNTGAHGWAAAALVDDGGAGDSWSDLVQRAERSFPDRDGAAMFLYGFDAARRWQRGQEALAAMPWRQRRPGDDLPEGRPHGVI